MTTEATLHEPSPTKTTNPRGEPPLWLTALPYLVLLAGAYQVFSAGSIGPFVTFRYAANLLAGHGPVYNVGEQVEGFTSPLHLALVTLLLATGQGVGIYFKAKLLGLALGFLGLWQLRRLARLVGLSLLEATLAQLLVGASADYALSAINGMETSLFICALLAATIAFVRERANDSEHWSAALLFLVLLSRPDGSLVFGFFFCLRLYDATRGRTTFRRLVKWAAMYAGLVVAFVAARWLYYGALVPNTYLAKTVSLGAALRAGARYLMLVHSTPWAPRYWTIASASVFWGLAGIGLWRSRGCQQTVVVALAAAGSIVFVLKSGVGAGIGWRYVEPAAPFLAILQVRGLSAIAGGRPTTPVRTPLFVGMSVAAMLVFAAEFSMLRQLSWPKTSFTTDDSTFLSAGSMGMGRQWVQEAELVRALVPPGSLVAAWDTGYMAWRNPQARFLDLRGLTDREVASLPKSFKSNIGVTDGQWNVPGDPLYAIWTRRRPDYVVVFNAAGLTLPGYLPASTVDDGEGPTVRIYARIRDPAG